jgi:ABC-type phosphate transport system substrate-binding protein
VRFLLLIPPFLWVLLPAPLPADGLIAVITQAVPPQSALNLEELARIYRRKKLFWEDGARVIPVNLPTDHPLRRDFSRLVLGALPDDQKLKEYWNAQYFHGIAPPYVLASEDAALQFVITTPGAIGYVSAAAVNAKVHVLLYLPLSADKKKP